MLEGFSLEPAQAVSVFLLLWVQKWSTAKNRVWVAFRSDEHMAINTGN